MRLLVVEDEPDLARTLERALEEEQFAVDLALEGDEALYKMTEIPYDVIVLDLMLPGRDGWSLLGSLRGAGKRTPVLVLTARDGIENRVRGLDLGADDYLTKPFALAELVARIRALIRRASVDPIPTLVIGEVTIDTAARTVCRGGRPVELTPREYTVFELLARRRGTLVTRAMVWEHIYNEAEDTVSNAVDVHVSALRRKLGREVIRTHRGHGYIIDA
ncbi:MAG: DNA-binding response regulator [Acidobacteria bacterium]|nr:MAG: DNA-binding response regulator [Acidobacteriota bacterium]